MIRDYISRSYKEVNSDLNSLTLNAPEKTFEITNLLMQEERFNNDFNFWCVVVMQRVASMTALGRIDELKDTIDNIFAKVCTCEDTDLYLDSCLKFSAAYSELGNQQKTIVTLINIINYEITYNLVSIRSVIAHNNLGLLHQQYNNFEQAKTYFFNALKILCDNRLSEPSLFSSRYVFIASNIAIIYAELNDIENCQLYIHYAKAHLSDQIASDSQHYFMESLVSYYYMIGDYNAMNQQFNEHIQLLISKKSYIGIPRLIIKYNRYLIRIHHDRSEFMTTVEHAIKIVEGHVSTHNIRNMYLIALNYYLEINQYTYVVSYYQKIKNILTKSDAAYRKQQLDTINTRINITQHYNQDKAVKKNLMLTQLNKYNQKNRKKLKIMYDRLRLITTIGQQITSSFKIDDIERLVHNELMKIIPIDTFVIFVENKEVLSSTYIYDNEAILSDFEINKNDRNSIVIQAFNEMKPIYSADIVHDKRFTAAIKMDYHAKKINHSVIYIPLIYNCTSIGVITIQAKQKNAYTKYHIKQLEHVSTYLSIALANANRTIELNQEINTYDTITKQLEARNDHLHKLSSVDGLTKVPNRRAFDNFFEHIIHNNYQKNTTINVFMLDIDEFKLYNDTYGHIAGDKALIAIAKMLHKFFREENMFFARYGGEEFIAITVGESPELALLRGEKMKKSIERLNIPNKKSHHQRLTVSIGISSVFACSDNCAAHLIKNADDQLYNIKFDGKNSVGQTIFSPS